MDTKLTPKCPHPRTLRRLNYLYYRPPALPTGPLVE